MTNQNPSQGYETGMLQQLIKNSEATAVIQFKLEEIEKQVQKIPAIESRLDSIESRLGNVETRLANIEKIGQKIVNISTWLIGGIILGIVVNILSIPALNLFN
jgi:tetrahydromethanopterin S-methyltransferase subunit G